MTSAGYQYWPLSSKKLQENNNGTYPIVWLRILNEVVYNVLPLCFVADSFHCHSGEAR